MEKKKFRAKKNAGISHKNAQIYGEELERIESINNGQLIARDIVEEARSKQSPLHEYFEWNNTDAAESFRLDQARRLLRSITVTIQVKGSKPEQVRYLHSVVSTQGEHSYITIGKMRQDEFYLNQVITNAEMEIFEWKKKYQQYKRLKEFRKYKLVFEALEKIAV
jgi:hypothetical protein